MRPANDFGELAAEGVIDVTVVVDADALEKGVLTTGLPDEDVIVVGEFFIEEREGGGGRVIGEDR